jgi:hypothetical protein
VYREPGAELPERPPISAPDRRWRDARQPGLGLRGLALVLPIAALLAVGWGGAVRSAAVLGPLVTYSLPLIAMVAFWWEDWPGTRLPSRWSGWVDTALIAVGAVALREAGQAVTGDSIAFPAAAFVAMLQLTLVGEGWPLRRLPRLTAGALALAASWAVALVVYFTLAGVRPDLAALLIVISAWQALFYVAGRGRPFSSIAARPLRLACGHTAVIAGGVATYAVVHGLLAVGRGPLAAWAGCFVAAALVAGMLLEGWLNARMTVIAAAALAVALAATLRAIAPDDWVIHATLNALGVSTILHVAIGGRWPFGHV